MENKNLSQKEIENIIELYTKTNISLRKLAKKINRSTEFIATILKKNNVYVYKNEEEAKTSEIKNKEIKKGNKLVAVCKKTGKTFDDWENKSGVLTNLVKELYPEYKMPSKFIRKQCEYKTGKFWYEEFFDIIEVEDEKQKLETKKCKYCDWTTYDLDNKSGMYTTHLKKKHNKDILQYTNEFPEEKWLFKTFFNKLKK
jgi:predicted HTH domain antitoxin